MQKDARDESVRACVHFEFCPGNTSKALALRIENRIHNSYSYSK